MKDPTGTELDEIATAWFILTFDPVVRQTVKESTAFHQLPLTLSTLSLTAHSNPHELEKPLLVILAERGFEGSVRWWRTACCGTGAR